MGIHVSEIEPVGELDQLQTRELAKDLWTEAGKQPGISPDIIDSVLQRYRAFDPGLSPDMLGAAGWFQDPAVAARRGIPDGRLALSDKAGAIANAPSQPRMTFDEAQTLLGQVQKRLDGAPVEIDGIRINSLYLYGSAVRDDNSRPTIGDLDLAADFGFDSRYDGLSRGEKIAKAKEVWNNYAGQGDERLQIGDAKDLPQMQGTPEKPVHLVRVWKNPRPGQSELTQEEAEVLGQREAQAVSTQTRARSVAGLAARAEGPQQPGNPPDANTGGKGPDDQASLSNPGLATRMRNMLSSGWQNAKVRLLSQFPVVGPHGSSADEAELLLSGKKPLGWINVVPNGDDIFYSQTRRMIAAEAKLDDAVSGGRLIAKDVLVHQKPPGGQPWDMTVRFYAQPGNEQDLAAMAAYHQKVWNGEKPDVKLDKSFGDYLGYRKRDQMLFDNLQKYRPYIPNSFATKLFQFNRDFAQPAYLEQLLGHPVDKQLTLTEQANNGDVSAQMRLGNMFQFGHDAPQDNGQALAWYTRAAAGGSPVAQWNLGLQYIGGSLGPQDAVEGATWISRAAEQGYPPAMTSLGNLYLEGSGVPQDDAKALDLFQRGAELGDAGSQGALGKLYAEGRGVTQDNIEAGFWYRLAGKGRPDFPFGGDVLAGLTTEQSKAIDERVQTWEAAHPSPKDVLKAQFKEGTATVEAPQKPVPEEEVSTRMPRPVRKVHPFESYLNSLAAKASLGADVALSANARKILVENSDTFLASLDPVSKLRAVKALDTISKTPEGKKLVDQFIESGVPLKLDQTRADTGGHFMPDYLLQPEGNVATVPVHVQASAFTSQGRLTNVLTHELEHLSQARNNNLSPVSLGKIPSADDIVLHNRFIEADAQAIATDVAYRLKLQGDPEAWKALHDLPDHRAIADAYEAAIQKDPAALENGYAKRAAFDGWFTATMRNGTTLVDMYNNNGSGFTASDRYIEELMKNGSVPTPLTENDYKRLGAQNGGANYLDLPDARPMDDPYYKVAGNFSVERADMLRRYRETYAKAQDAFAKSETFDAERTPMSERTTKPIAPKEPPPQQGTTSTAATQAFDEFLRSYRKGTAYVKNLPQNAKIALDTPSALVTSIPRVAQHRLNSALDDIASVPGGEALSALAKESDVSLRMNNDPLQRGAEIRFDASGAQAIHLQGYSTKGALVLQMAQQLQHVRQTKAGLLSPFADGLRTPEEAMVYEQFRNADAQATATEIAYKLKLAGKPDAWKALQGGQVLPAGLADAYEKAIAQDAAALTDGRAKRAAFDASFAEKGKTAVGYDAALRHYPSADALANMMDMGKPVKALAPDDLKKFGALSDVNYLDVPGERPLNDPYYGNHDLNAQQVAKLARFRAQFNAVAPRVDPKNAKTVLLQHGTSEANLKSILEKGFQPRYRSARDKVRDVVKTAVPEADVEAKVTEVLAKSQAVSHRAHEVSDILYTTSDTELAKQYAVKVANSGGEVKGQIYRELGIPESGNPYDDARPVKMVLRAPTGDVIREEGQTFRSLAWGDATVDSSHEVLLKQQGNIEVLGIAFAKKDGNGWSFDGQPYLSPAEALKQIQPQFAGPRDSVPTDRNRRAILKEIVDFQLGPDVKISQPHATYVAEAKLRDENGVETLARVPDPSFEPMAEKKFGKYFAGTAAQYKMPYDLTPVEVDGYLKVLDIKEQRGTLTSQEKHARLERLYNEMERVNPELGAVTVDRSNPVKLADAVHGVVNNILPRDIQFHLQGAPQTPEYKELSRQTAGMDWNFSPSTLTNIQQQMEEKNRTQAQWLKEQAGARNRVAQAETDLGETLKREASAPRQEQPGVRGGNYWTQSSGDLITLEHGTSEGNLYGILTRGMQPFTQDLHGTTRQVLQDIMPGKTLSHDYVQGVLNGSGHSGYRADQTKASTVFATLGPDSKSARNYAITYAADGGEFAAQIRNTATRGDFVPPRFPGARPVLITFDAPRKNLTDTVVPDKEDYESWKREGTADFFTDQEVGIRNTDGISVKSVTFATKDAGGKWTFEGQPALSPAEAMTAIQPKFVPAPVTGTAYDRLPDTTRKIAALWREKPVTDMPWKPVADIAQAGLSDISGEGHTRPFWVQSEFEGKTVYAVAKPLDKSSYATSAALQASSTGHETPVNDKIAFDLAYDAGVPVAPAALWENDGGKKFVLSLKPFENVETLRDIGLSRGAGERDMRLIKNLPEVTSASVFHIFAAQNDDHTGNILFDARNPDSPPVFIDYDMAFQPEVVQNGRPRVKGLADYFEEPPTGWTNSDSVLRAADMNAADATAEKIATLDRKHMQEIVDRIPDGFLGSEEKSRLGAYFDDAQKNLDGRVGARFGGRYADGRWPSVVVTSTRDNLPDDLKDQLPGQEVSDRLAGEHPAAGMAITNPREGAGAVQGVAPSATVATDGAQVIANAPRTTTAATSAPAIPEQATQTSAPMPITASGQTPAMQNSTAKIAAPVTEPPTGGQPRASKFLAEQHQGKISPAPKETSSGIGGTGAGVVGIVLSAQGLKQAIDTHDKLEVGIGGINLATSTVQTAEGFLKAAGKTMPVIKGAGKFVPGLNVGVTLVDGVYQISKEDTREHKMERGTVVAATAATGFIVGAATATVAETAAVTTGVAAVLGTSAAVTGAAAFAVAAAPVVLTAAAVVGVAYVGNKVIEAKRAWEKTEKEMAEQAKPQKRAGYVSPDGKPSVFEYKHVAVEMMRISPDMKDENLSRKPGRDKNGRILVDDIRKMDMRDPKNIAEFQRVLDANIGKQKEIMKANDSFLPRWMRSSSSADKYTNAQMELGDLTAAKAEMAMYQKDLQAYQKAHPEQTNAPAVTSATVRKSVHQKLNS